MKRRLSHFLLVILCLYFSASKVYGQQLNYRFEHLSERQGLSNGSVWSIIQDSEGFMWFGTEEGLNKYDGYTFTTFYPDPHHPDKGLQHNIISDIHEDKKGHLWVATFGGGLHLVNKNTGEITAYGIEPIRIDGWNVFTSIHEDPQGMLWIAAGKGLVCFNPETKEFIKYPNPTQSFTICVAEDHTGGLWIGTWNDLFQFDRDSGKFSRVLLDTNMAKQPQVWSLHVDKEGILWLGTREDGLYHLNIPACQDQFHRFNPNGLVNKNIHFNGIYEDKDGFLWLATTEGLQRIDDKTYEVITFRSDPQLPDRIGQNAISTTYQSRHGTLWVGTNTGIYKASPRYKKFNTYQLAPALPYLSESKNAITDLHVDTTETLWLASTAPNFTKSFRNGLYQYDVKHRGSKRISLGSNNLYSLSSEEVWAIYQDRNGQLWIGTTEGLNLLDRKTMQFTHYPSKYPVHYIDEAPSGALWVGGDSAIASFDQHLGTYNYYINKPDDSLSLNDHYLFDILASSSGDIYIATASRGINRLDPETGEFTYYMPDQSSPEGHLNDKHIITLYEDSQGIIWIGTNQGGLNRFDPHTEKFTFFSTQEGLASNHVSSIISDKNDNLWIGTSRGLSRFNPITKVFTNYSNLDGLPSNGFVKGSVQNHKGSLLFGTTNGFVIFEPDSIQPNNTVPPVYITGLQVMDEERDVPGQPIELAHDQNFLSFEFVALNYDVPEKNQYAYMLEGVDKDWFYSDTRRFARYTDLDPGEYKFRVKASNNDGIWNEEGAFLHVTILPPWWKTGWAYVLYTILGFSLLCRLRHYTVKRERLKHELNIQRLESEKMHEIDRMKNRFFANISHEFRTPLTLILGPIEKLLSEADESKKELYQMMRRNAGRLLSLINQLLDLAKLEAGSLELYLQPHALLPFLKGIVFSFSSLAERKNIKYHFQYPSENPVLYFDADKLEKVIMNLLSNAFKFTPTGGEVLFSAYLKQEEGKAKDYLLEIQVKDSGIGITEAQQSRIFNRFYQADATKEEGSGIGLSLVSELVDLYQGKISVESQPDKGSIFYVSIPLEKADFEEVQIHQHKELISKEASEDTLPLQSTEKIEEAPHILVVEDNEDVRSFIIYILQDIYQVSLAGDGREGLQKAIEYIPDLILSDVMMPRMDGITLCEKLKQEQKTSHIPIIMLTAKASGGDKIEGLKTGADDYIIKPFQAEELLIRIENLITSRQQLREQFSRQVSLEPMSMNINSTEERFIQKVREVMEEHMTDFSFGVEVFGESLNMSKMQLYRKLKALTDYTPSEFIRTMRMKRAAELLEKGAGNIGEVAYMVGYQDHAYFTRNFHKYYGMTPSEYIAIHVKQ
jgi:signal transduction histidine kinase/ligand-binding sensor domain-containing protein/DNA-binding response OmpR family regulator